MNYKYLTEDILTILGFVLAFTAMVFVIFIILNTSIEDLKYLIALIRGENPMSDFDRYQAEVMANISDEEFEKVKSQLTEDNLFLDKFYLTEKYFYCPSEKALIPYEHIGHVSIQKIYIRSYRHNHHEPRLALNCKGYGTMYFPVGKNTQTEAFLIELRKVLEDGSRKMNRTD